MCAVEYGLKVPAREGRPHKVRHKEQGSVGGLKVTTEARVIRWQKERGQRESTRRAVFPFALVGERHTETRACRPKEWQKVSASYFKTVVLKGTASLLPELDIILPFKWI